MRWISLALLLFVLPGCAAPIQATRNLPQPASLTEVNALLDGRKHLTVELADGVRLTKVRDAVVTSDGVRFVRGGDAYEFSVARIERITYVRNRGVAAGTAIGVAPGAALVGFSALVIASAPADPFAGLIGLMGAGVGAGVMGVGGSLGAAIGSVVSPGGVVPLYEGPIERYLDAPPVLARTEDM